MARTTIGSGVLSLCLERHVAFIVGPDFETQAIAKYLGPNFDPGSFRRKSKPGDVVSRFCPELKRTLHAMHTENGDLTEDWIATRLHCLAVVQDVSVAGSLENFGFFPESLPSFAKLRFPLVLYHRV